VDEHPGTWPVSAAMSAEFASLRAEDRLDLADQVMQLGRVRHMPVIDADGRVIGIVSHRDLLEASLSRLLALDPAARRAFLGSVEIAQVMTRHVETIAPDATLARAAERMLHHKIGCLPVVGGDGVMIGILTETDLLRCAYGEHPAGGPPPA
jgi:CBS domain-containing protein